jgi:hypothetical protein
MSGSSFRSMVQGLVQTAFGIVGDLNDPISYNSVSSAPYNPVTGVVTTVATPYNFNGVISKFTTTEADNKVVIATDAKLLCAMLDLPITPTPQDTLTSVDPLTKNTLNWKVMRVIATPGQSLWVIHIRGT